MTARMVELQTRVRTPDCELIENDFRDNLADLRVLVAKEYCIMLIGKYFKQLLVLVFLHVLYKAF